MEIGEVWGYRASAKHDLVMVTVLKIGAQRPARVQVRFEGDKCDGHTEWVPPARLQVPWKQVHAFEADESRLAEVAAASDLHREGPEVGGYQGLYLRPGQSNWPLGPL